MCKKNGWVAEVEQHGVLDALDERRAEWRKKREAGEVGLDALMPIERPLEEAWKYYVPQPLPEDVVKHAPTSIREFKLIDPACGSGHFLVVAFDLLVELYREEARHRGESWTNQQIAEWILENNLHGVDIDPRAVQIAAAAIFLKARTLAKDASPRHVNLVAPVLRLSALDRKDPALLKLERDIELETGIPPELTRQLLDVLAGVDHLGTLLKVGDAVDRAIEAFQGKLGKVSRQRDLFAGAEAEQRIDVDKKDAKRLVLERLNAFLADHAGEEDLGLRLRGQQLTAGLRFASIVRTGEYHLVMANPPYQGTSRLKNAGYIAKHYPRGKSDLYAAFLERGLELCRPGGASAMVTMRSWMFLSGFTALREHLLQTYDLRVIGDVDRGAFEEIPDEVVATTMSVFRRATPAVEPSVAMLPTPLDDKSRDSNRTARKRAATLAQVRVFKFTSRNLEAIKGRPLVYWWTPDFLKAYAAAPKLGDIAPARFGLTTGNNERFVRYWWEVNEFDPTQFMAGNAPPADQHIRPWVPFILGAKGQKWFEPLTYAIRWIWGGFELRVFAESSPGAAIRNPLWYFKRGIAFSMVGLTFSARVHLYRSVFGNKGSSLFPDDLASTVCALNTEDAQFVLRSLNSGMFFEVGDVNRLPVTSNADSPEVFRVLQSEFQTHERSRENSVEFRRPGPHKWQRAQEWAEQVLSSGIASNPWDDAPEDSPEASAFLSFKIGVALGRFDGEGHGIQTAPPPGSLQKGILYCSERTPLTDGALAGLQDEWSRLALAQGSATLETWLRHNFFEYHRKIYDNRPIYLPLSSTKKSFVAFISIHRWTNSTLSSLLADHLIPEQKAIQGALVDLKTARSDPDKKIRAAAEKNYVQHKKWLEELEDFIHKVQEVAEKGPPPLEEKTEHREVDAPYRMNLDDGVMVNSAALWPLLDPMWKEPKKWWREIANPKGKYDWSHLANYYFPSRVDGRCRKDPSLAVAHGCFWKYHPEKAYQWELRLQDEIGPDFKLDEKDSDVLRAAFLENQPSLAREIEAAEQARRERKARKQDQEELDLSETDNEESADDEAVSA